MQYGESSGWFIYDTWFWNDSAGGRLLFSHISKILNIEEPLLKQHESNQSATHILTDFSRKVLLKFKCLWSYQGGKRRSSLVVTRYVKPQAFWYFQLGQKGTLGRKGLREITVNVTFV